MLLELEMRNDFTALKQIHVLKSPRNERSLFSSKQHQTTVFNTDTLQLARVSDSAAKILRDLEIFCTEDIIKKNVDVDTLEALNDLIAWSKPVSKTPGHQQTEGKAHKFSLNSLTINVTQICNLQCKYCAAGGDGSYGDPIKKISVDATIPSLKGLMEKMATGSEFQITFLGGEPLLYPQGIDVLAEEAEKLAIINKLKLKMTLVTNGTLFTEANIELIKKFKMNVTVSIDGPAEVNDLRRPTKSGRGTTAQVIEGLNRLLKFKNEIGQILLSGVFGKGNLDLMAAYNFYRQFDVDWFDFTYDHLETSPEINKKFTEELLRVAEFAFRSEGEAGLRRIHTFDRWILTLDRQEKVQNYCSAGKSFLMMDAKQNLYTCPWVVGDADEIVGRQDQLWSEKLAEYQEDLVDKHGCQSCFARYLCGGGCMYINKKATGDKHKVDKEYCLRTQSLIEQTLMYYEEMRSYEKGESYAKV